MSMRKMVTVMLVTGFLSAVTFGEEPPAAPPRNPGVGMKVPPELDVYQKGDLSASMVRARELRQRADQGDAEATYQFAALLAELRASEANLDGQQKGELSELSGSMRPSDWMMKAAEAGSQPAIDAICKIGEDPLAPARLRDRDKLRCEELRRKYPAPTTK